MTYSYPNRLFDCIGVELEYMIVDRRTLDVLPVTDELLKLVAGAYESEVEPDGPDSALAWSNELTLHVVELKTNGPAKSIAGLAGLFQRDVGRINALLEGLGEGGARLMPTAMHPWMDPHTEMRLWPHEHNPVYEAYNRIFDCRGHGWANLQSTHINLPFGNDEEFGRLHAAIRLVLPIIPALAASSPVADGRVTGWLDTRMNNYKGHAKAIQSVLGTVVPEQVFTREAYERDILGRMYADVKPYDPEGVLQHEFLNARAAMARFDRGAIEIRVIDIQECPAADAAVCAAVVGAVRGLVEERWAGYEEQCAWAPEPLYAMLMAVSRDGEEAVIEDEGFLRLWGARETTRRAGELGGRLVAEVVEPGEHDEALRVMVERGPLARRMLRGLGVEVRGGAAVTGGTPVPREKLKQVYGELCDCLTAGILYGKEY
jgi:gamma-glutamyl:cysteine ligase YbdK (ATP-grasp superfamily)